MSARSARESATAAQSRLKEHILDLNNYEAEQTLRLPLAEVAPFRSIENSRDPEQEQQDVKRRKVHRDVLSWLKDATVGSLDNPIEIDDDSPRQTQQEKKRKPEYIDDQSPVKKRSTKTGSSKTEPERKKTKPKFADRYAYQVIENFTPLPAPPVPGHAGLAVVFERRFGDIYRELSDNVKSYASEFWKTQLIPENREIWRSKLAAGLPPHVVTALCAPEIRLADLLTYETTHHGVYVKVASSAGFPELAYVGSATNLPKHKGAQCGMPVRRAQHEATFADASSATTFDIEARKLGLTQLSFGTLFEYEVANIDDTQELEDRRVTCKIVEAILTEWCRAGQWHNSDRFGGNSDWFGACSHCCLTEGVRGISTNYRPSREEYNSVQRGYNGRAYHTNKQWKANNPERHRANKARAKALELERMRADPKLRAKENQRIRESRARSKARKLAAEERV